MHSKILAFELRCPVPFRIWRSAVTHLLYRFAKARLDPIDIAYGREHHDVVSIINLPRQELPSYSQFHLAYFHQSGLDHYHDGPRLGYAFEQLSLRSEFWFWGNRDGAMESQHTTYRSFFDGGAGHGHDSCVRTFSMQMNLGVSEGEGLAGYIGSTIHTSNDILSSQADCPADLFLDEYIALGHLRSGGSLQWLNILRELRSRSLNLRSHKVHFLLAQATSQVGPLDVNTGDWVWHQELQNPSFCNGVLDELQSLFMDASAGSLDEVTMRTISMLLTRVLASSPCEGVSERALRLLRDVRRKTLVWVQELAYNLIQAPTNKERRQRLYNMATTCRSTFDVNTSSLCKVLHSAEDVEAVLSCAFFIQATSQVPDLQKCDQPNCRSGHFISSDIDDYSGLLHQRDRRLSVAVEGALRDAIQADVSDRGIDLAVHDIWPGYRPGPRRWEPEEHPNSHWLVCTTAGTADNRSQIVRINLLDGSLLVDGRPLGGLPREIREHSLYKQVLHGVCRCQGL